MWQQWATAKFYHHSIGYRIQCTNVYYDCINLLCWLWHEPLVFCRKSALDELFKKHDKDNAGFLTFEQAVKAGMERCPNMSENSVKEMVTHFDKDKNDKIDMNEFSEFFISLAILWVVLYVTFSFDLKQWP